MGRRLESRDKKMSRVCFGAIAQRAYPILNNQDPLLTPNNGRHELNDQIDLNAVDRDDAGFTMRHYQRGSRWVSGETHPNTTQAVFLERGSKSLIPI